MSKYDIMKIRNTNNKNCEEKDLLIHLHNVQKQMTLR